MAKPNKLRDAKSEPIQAARTPRRGVRLSRRATHGKIKQASRREKRTDTGGAHASERRATLGQTF